MHKYFVYVCYSGCAGQLVVLLVRGRHFFHALVIKIPCLGNKITRVGNKITRVGNKIGRQFKVAFQDMRLMRVTLRASVLFDWESARESIVVYRFAKISHGVLKEEGIHIAVAPIYG